MTEGEEIEGGMIEGEEIEGVVLGDDIEERF
jgi:hypothetical protein